MKASGLFIAILALSLWGEQAPVYAQSIASAANISTSEAPGDLKQLETMWKLVLAKSADGQFLVQNLDGGNRECVLTAILKEAEELGGMPQALGMTPRAPMVGVFVLKEHPFLLPYITPTEDAEVHLQNLRMQAKSLVNNFREYVRLSRALQNADGKLDCKLDDRPEFSDPSARLEWEYQFRRAQRDIDQLVDDLKRMKTSLVDMVGAEAVRRLDDKLIGPDSIRPLNEIDRFKFHRQFVDPVRSGAGTS